MSRTALALPYQPGCIFTAAARRCLPRPRWHRSDPLIDARGLPEPTHPCCCSQRLDSSQSLINTNRSASRCVRSPAGSGGFTPRGGQVSYPPPAAEVLRWTRRGSSQEAQLQLELAAWRRRCVAFTEHESVNVSQLGGAGHQKDGRRQQKRPLNGETSDSITEIFQRFQLLRRRRASTTICRYYLASPRLKPPTSDLLHREEYCSR